MNVEAYQERPPHDQQRIPQPSIIASSMWLLRSRSMRSKLGKDSQSGKSLSRMDQRTVKYVLKTALILQLLAHNQQTKLAPKLSASWTTSSLVRAPTEHLKLSMSQNTDPRGKLIAMEALEHTNKP
jgi:hypothetical protein